MLHHIKIPGRRSAWHYPKTQLSYMLILTHWQKHNHYSYRMMLSNMGIYNEELGEIGFSILSRVVLGDHCKNDFEHMDRMYKLLPVYRDLKNEVLKDNAVSTSLSWRHKIDCQGDEVQAATVFFKKSIRLIQHNTFRSYSHDMRTYSTAITATSAMSATTIPEVFMSRADLMQYVNNLYRAISIDLSGYFVYKHHDIWPEAKPDLGVEQHDELCDDSGFESDDELEQEEEIEDLVGIGQLPPEQKSQNDAMSPHNSDEDINDDNHSAQQQIPVSPFERRTWSAWGVISPQNQMVGRRPRNQPERLLPSKRRVVWVDPKD